jgi:peptidoglycan hydrolase FlgJ
MADATTAGTAGATLAAQQSQQGDLVALKQQVDRLRGDLTPGKSTQQKLRKACTDFEAVFISKMWEQMRNTVPKEGYLHSSQEDMYRSMFDRDFAEKLAGDGGIGLGDMLYSQLQDKLKGAAKTASAGGSVAASNTEATSGSQQTATGTTAAQQAAAEPPKASAIKPLRQSISRDLNATTLKKSTGLPLKDAARISALTRVTAPAPERPASVSGEVMGEVDALARRIEADYDLRQQTSAMTPTQRQAAMNAMNKRFSGQGPATGRKFATTG